MYHRAQIMGVVDGMESEWTSERQALKRPTFLGRLGARRCLGTAVVWLHSPPHYLFIPRMTPAYI